MSPEREIALIKNVKEGDQSAFAMLASVYKNRLYSYLLKISFDKDETEDLLQEVLIKVWKGIKGYDERNKFSSWLFSIAHNTAMDGLRKRKVRNIFTGRENYENESSGLSPENLVLHKETEEMIEKIVSGLPEKQKEVFLLRQYGEMTFKEISEQMNEPLNTVLSHMHYAVKKIRKVLKVSYEK